MMFARLLSTVQLRIRSLFKRNIIEGELDEEVAYHVDRQIQENLKRGMTADEARYAAMRAFGGLVLRKEECRDVRRVRFIQDAVRDLSYGVRNLMRNPGFALVVVLTMAFGIGANAAIFSILEAVLLRPLPFPDPGQLVTIDSVKPSTATGTFRMASPADFLDWQKLSTTLDHIAAFSGNGMTLRETDQPETIYSARVTAGFFEALAVPPLLGRTFIDDEWSNNGPP